MVRLWAAPLLHYTWKFWLGIAILVWPLLLATRFVDALLHRLAGRTAELPDEESFEEQIRAIVTEGHREGFLEADAREMIKGVIELGDADTSEVMTPRTDMVSMPLALSWQDTLDFVVKVGHTRIPVYDKNLDDIVGHEITTCAAIGPYDLSHDLGVGAQWDNPKYLEAREEIRAAAKRAGKVMWMIGDGPSLAKEGFTFICVGEPSVILESAMTQITKQTRGEASEDSLRGYNA